MRHSRSLLQIRARLIRLTHTKEHVDRLADVLLTYGFWERELGYVQGMSDLCAPLYVVLEGDDPLVFWCFVEWMEIMVRLPPLALSPPSSSTTDENSRSPTSYGTSPG